MWSRHTMLICVLFSPRALPQVAALVGDGRALAQLLCGSPGPAVANMSMMFMSVCTML